MNLKDKKILRKLKAGDIQSFENLFHTYYPGMCSYAESLVKKEEIAEEVVQDVFYNIWKNRNELKITSSCQSYLYRATFNNSMMYLRRAKREISLDQQWASNNIEATEHAHHNIDESELKAIIIYTLQKLPERTRTIFNKSRFDGMKYIEIAKEMGISVKTVESNMGKALKALRVSLQEFRKTA
ncbi:MAG TPA: RNA polymerase sigma-70 factor [Bacteroidales bacterium]|nr:RNA polymerase sigma-70 factor [Bacteroidales bacterium]